MDFGRRAAATAGVDGGYRLLDPSTAQGDEIVLLDHNSSTGVDCGYRLLGPSTAQGDEIVLRDRTSYFLRYLVAVRTLVCLGFSSSSKGWIPTMCPINYRKVKLYSRRNLLGLLPRDLIIMSNYLDKMYNARDWKKNNGGGFGDAGQMTVDALRMEHLKESFRQELIVAELAKQRELGPEVRRELGLENAGPLCDRTGLRLTTLPQQNTSPVRQDSQLQCILPSSELCLDQALTTRGQPLMPGRRLAKERIEEWYQPPWRRSQDDDDTSLISVSLYSSWISSVLIVAHRC
jgi:hypothetical protein